ENARHDHACVERGATRAETDGSERLADGDDHDQAVALREVRRVDTPALQAGEQRPEESDDEGKRPDRGPPARRRERSRDDERGSAYDWPGDPQHRREQVRLALAHERVEPDEASMNLEEGDGKHESVRAEARGGGGGAPDQ